LFDLSKLSVRRIFCFVTEIPRLRFAEPGAMFFSLFQSYDSRTIMDLTVFICFDQMMNYEQSSAYSLDENSQNEMCFNLKIWTGGVPPQIDQSILSNLSVRRLLLFSFYSPGQALLILGLCSSRSFRAVDFLEMIDLIDLL
jgi:hypothetical protein